MADKAVARTEAWLMADDSADEFAELAVPSDEATEETEASRDESDEADDMVLD